METTRISTLQTAICTELVKRILMIINSVTFEIDFLSVHFANLWSVLHHIYCTLIASLKCALCFEITFN